ncbi:uncharacterized mitochondrial protein-like protein [Tanacetum coccineum]
MDLYGPMLVESINGKKYVLVIVDDYSRYTWTHFLRSKDETPEKTLHAYFAKEGIRHETSTAQTPEQNGVVERRNRTLVEAARTMLSAVKVPLFFWAEAIATAWYSTQSRAYRVFNKRTRIIVETIHVNFDELPQIASDQLDLLLSLMFDELLNGTPSVVSNSSAVTAADAPDKHHQQHTTQSSTTVVAADTPPLNILTSLDTTSQAPTVTATENIIQAETTNENAQVDDDEFIKLHLVHDHSLEQVIGNPSQSIRTRCQLETDGKMYMFALTMNRTEPKNIKEAMADSAWIETIQEELHQFD